MLVANTLVNNAVTTILLNVKNVCNSLYHLHDSLGSGMGT